ncbi:Leucine-rich repeat serine/threonine-protein kinase 2, partial [Podochytrium sp. JEL0797]
MHWLASLRGQDTRHGNQTHALVRIQTSVGSFVAPGSGSVGDLLREANRLLRKLTSHTPHVLVALVTVDGDLLDLDLSAAQCTVPNQELIGLSQEQRSALRPRVHAFFRANPLFASSQDIEQGPPKDPPINPDTKQVTFPRNETDDNDDDDDDDDRDVLPERTPLDGSHTPSVVERASLTIFVSYCWGNSVSVSGEKAVGHLDPRFLREYLATEGFTDVWIDHEQIKTGDDLFEQIANGLMSSDIAIVCVSDEYATSKNCMRELNFALNVMKLPYIPIVVGTGFNWQRTKVGFMFGDQTYLDATDPLLVPEKLETLVTSLDRILAATARQYSFDQYSIAAPPNPSEQDVPTNITNESPAPPNPPDFHFSPPTEIDVTFTSTPRLPNLRVGDKVELLRWRESNKNLFVGGGLHWLPVEIKEFGPPSNPDFPSGGRLIKVLFQSRVSYTKTRNGPLTMRVQSEETEWVDEFLVRKVSEMPREMPELDVGDAVEFRMFVHRTKAVMRNGVGVSGAVTEGVVSASGIAGSGVAASVVDSASVLEEEEGDQDSYIYWPAFVVTKMANRKYLLRQSKGMGLLSENGNYGSALKPVSVKMLRIGHDSKLVRVRQALAANHLVVLPKGSIVRTSCIPDIPTDDTFSVPDPSSLSTTTISPLTTQLIPLIHLVLAPADTTTDKGTYELSPSKFRTKQHRPKAIHASQDALRTPREKFLEYVALLWKEANAVPFTNERETRMVVWMSHALRGKGDTTPAAESTGRGVDARYLIDMVSQRNIHVLDSHVEVGDVEEGDEEEVLRRLRKGIVK